MIRFAAVAAITLMMACGPADGVDGPGDCGSDEYYEETEDGCVTCPAVVEPECPSGCDAERVDEDSECPALECESDCNDS